MSTSSWRPHHSRPRGRKLDRLWALSQFEILALQGPRFAAGAVAASISATISFIVHKALETPGAIAGAIFTALLTRAKLHQVMWSAREHIRIQNRFPLRENGAARDATPLIPPVHPTGREAVSSIWPVAARTTCTASPITSAGHFSPFGPLGIWLVWNDKREIGRVTQSDEWASVEAEARRIIAESAEPFTGETIAQIGDFLKYLRERTAAPKVAKGYWSTIRVWWEHDNVEFEIFSDRLEIYRFRDKATGIRHVDHIAGEPFPATIEAELPKPEISN
jgi:hypothetical protein